MCDVRSTLQAPESHRARTSRASRKHFCMLYADRPRHFSSFSSTALAGNAQPLHAAAISCTPSSRTAAALLRPPLHLMHGALAARALERAIACSLARRSLRGCAKRTLHPCVLCWSHAVVLPASSCSPCAAGLAVGRSIGYLPGRLAGNQSMLAVLPANRLLQSTLQILCARQPCTYGNLPRNTGDAALKASL